jgi:hypothetical protein
VAADGTHGSDLLLGSEPLLNHDLFAVDHANVHCQVTEIASELSSWAADRDNASVDLAADTFREFNNLVAVDSSHDLKGLRERKHKINFCHQYFARFKVSEINKLNFWHKSTSIRVNSTVFGDFEEPEIKFA